MCAETIGPAVALFSGLLISSSFSSVSYSSLSTITFVSFGTVGTGGFSAIGIEVVADMEPGGWFDKGLGEGVGKERGEVAGKYQGWV